MFMSPAKISNRPPFSRNLPIGYLYPARNPHGVILEIDPLKIGYNEHEKYVIKFWGLGQEKEKVSLENTFLSSYHQKNCYDI
ncbi:Hypothetical predicted protein [Octopus vulgaris]|uniref:Uncharacterized protein n=1 Tax=Octopus vulgaris TaxID=6645 RepID=A0AA36F036_OCTVU|nr:Hypothetical predicted protein [Octopus vulgaris]